jgi:hypothetical protein
MEIFYSSVKIELEKFIVHIAVLFIYPTTKRLVFVNTTTAGLDEAAMVCQPTP